MSITDERAKTHGNYEHLARLSQDLKARIRQEPHTLTHKQLESLEMICVKIARIVCGDANEPDHWIDISGYAELIHKRQAASGSSPQQEPPDEDKEMCPVCHLCTVGWNCYRADCHRSRT